MINLEDSMSSKKRPKLWNPALDESDVSPREKQTPPPATVLLDNLVKHNWHELFQPIRGVPPIPFAYQNYMQFAPLLAAHFHNQTKAFNMLQQHVAVRPHVQLPQMPQPPGSPYFPSINGYYPSQTGWAFLDQSDRSYLSLSGGGSGARRSAVAPQNAAVAAAAAASACRNPLVASVIGESSSPNPPNHNCCAICGVHFRLTGDLVQHMRSNHRSSKFKRPSRSADKQSHTHTASTRLIPPRLVPNMDALMKD